MFPVVLVLETELIFLNVYIADMTENNVLYFFIEIIFSYLVYA